MFKKMIRGTIAMAMYFCVATVLAEVIVITTAVSQWQVDGDRVAQMVAAAKGLASASGEGLAAEPPKKDDASREQPSFEEILQSRAARDLNLQFREQQLVNALSQLRTSQQTLVDDESRYRKQKEEYQRELDAVRTSAASAGMEQVSDVLQRIKPKQAKALMLAMIDDKETEKVARQLAGMSETKRAKIIAEFKTDDELKKVREVLRLFEQGAPEGPLSENAKKKLEESVAATGANAPAAAAPTSQVPAGSAAPAAK
jgi:flagellar motility protein MotE (MotC chaperone)